jgi:hypothetical protein
MVTPITWIQALFLLGTGYWVMRHQTSAKWHQPVLFGLIFAYFFLFYSNSLGVFSMAGDNICQIAYWKILLHPHLAGSIGAAYTKPGQLLLLGTFYELSELFGPVAFNVGLCLTMAICIWILTRIAMDIGGGEAGIIALLIATPLFLQELFAGSYSIPLIATTYSGLWLYFNKGRKILGSILLVLTIQFHIQAVAMLAGIWLILLWKKEWKELAAFTGACMGSLTLWLLVILRVQGAFNRTDSGAAVGYISHQFGTSSDNVLLAAKDALYHSPSLSFLMALAAIGIIGSLYLSLKQYLVVFCSIIPVILYVIFVSHGGMNMSRFLALIYAFGCSVGTGSLVRYFSKLSSNIITNKRIFIVLTTITVATSSVYSTLATARYYNSGDNSPSNAPYIESARMVLSESNLPVSLRLMTEDDILYPIVVMSPARCTSLSALQNFSVASESARIKILAKTDFIWIATDHGHKYYYLDYVPVPSWRTDPFRVMVLDILAVQQPRSLYGYQFTPVARDQKRLLLRVFADSSPHSSTSRQ